MGRGRAKAKQTKVARNLKYRTADTDFGSLERELRGDRGEGEIPDAYADMESGYGVDDPDDDGHDGLRKSG